MRIPKSFALGLLLAGCALPRSTPQPYEAEIQKFEQADRESFPPAGGVVFTGSSSIRLWTTLAEDLPNTPVINRGFGGSQLEDVLRYADRLVLPYHPRMVLVYAGDNDLASGKSPERVLADYRAIVQRIHRSLPATRIGFISIKPSPSRWHLATSVRSANALVREFASRDPRLFYIDVFTPMLGPDGLPREELFIGDKLHMTPQGYAVWRSVIAPYVEGSAPAN